MNRSFLLIPFIFLCVGCPIKPNATQQKQTAEEDTPKLQEKKENSSGVTLKAFDEMCQEVESLLNECAVRNIFPEIDALLTLQEAINFAKSTPAEFDQFELRQSEEKIKSIFRENPDAKQMILGFIESSEKLLPLFSELLAYMQSIESSTSSADGQETEMEKRTRQHAHLRAQSLRAQLEMLQTDHQNLQALRSYMQ